MLKPLFLLRQQSSDPFYSAALSPLNTHNRRVFFSVFLLFFPSRAALPRFLSEPLFPFLRRLDLTLRWLPPPWSRRTPTFVFIYSLPKPAGGSLGALGSLDAHLVRTRVSILFFRPVGFLRLPLPQKIISFLKPLPAWEINF